MGWIGLSAAVRGRKPEGKPCQDAVAVRHFPGDVIVAALSDGAGSAACSHVGARFLVDGTIRFLERARRYGWLRIDAAGAQQLFVRLLTDLRGRLPAVAAMHGCAVRDLNATLTGVVASPSWLAAFQVGDGFIVVRDAAARAYRLLFLPTKGEFANQTVFVQHPRAIDHLQVHVQPWPAGFFCLSSDGMERLALDMRWLEGNAPGPGDPRLHAAPERFFGSLERSMDGARQIDKANRELAGFLAAPYVSRLTDDDRSMAVCVLDAAPRDPDTRRQTPRADQLRMPRLRGTARA